MKPWQSSRTTIVPEALDDDTVFLPGKSCCSFILSGPAIIPNTYRLGGSRRFIYTLHVVFAQPQPRNYLFSQFAVKASLNVGVPPDRVAWSTVDLLNFGFCIKNLCIQLLLIRL